MSNFLPKHLGGHCNITHLDTQTLDYLNEKYHFKTAWDLGCGPGGMVSLMIDRGIDCIGIDGDYTLKRNIPCKIIDFTKDMPTNLPQVDFCWTVEFLEHVSEKFMDNYFPVLESASIIMATASPYEKGHHHVNVNDCDWWIEKFESRGFTFLEDDTKEIRVKSNMSRDFIRDTGMVFKNEY